MCFFFNDTATTEIYTYGHTLSLHDALPICSRAPPSPAGVSDMLNLREYRNTADRLADHLPWAALIAPGVVLSKRSEEHTSELQSLMRISYAVFCLKKKTTQQ